MFCCTVIEALQAVVAWIRVTAKNMFEIWSWWCKYLSSLHFVNITFLVSHSFDLGRDKRDTWEQIDYDCEFPFWMRLMLTWFRFNIHGIDGAQQSKYVSKPNEWASQKARNTIEYSIGVFLKTHDARNASWTACTSAIPRWGLVRDLFWFEIEFHCEKWTKKLGTHALKMKA